MTRPLSNDLRERVVAAIASGKSCRSIATRFGVPVSLVVKWSQRHRATGSTVPSKMGELRSDSFYLIEVALSERVPANSLLRIERLTQSRRILSNCTEKISEL